MGDVDDLADPSEAPTEFGELRPVARGHAIAELSLEFGPLGLERDKPFRFEGFEGTQHAFRLTAGVVGGSVTDGGGGAPPVVDLDDLSEIIQPLLDVNMGPPRV